MLNTIKNKLDPRPNAIGLLKNDHREVEGLFGAYKDAKDARKKKSIVASICEALEAHTKIEEKIFYPVVKEHKDLADMVNEALVEHAGAKKLIRELKNGSPADELYDARVTVLEEYIRHHVKEEEAEMFPKVEETDLDLVELGERMSAAKERILEAA